MSPLCFSAMETASVSYESCETETRFSLRRVSGSSVYSLLFYWNKVKNASGSFYFSKENFLSLLESSGFHGVPDQPVQANPQVD